MAWFLASYVREALSRTRESDLPSLRNVREALEEVQNLLGTSTFDVYLNDKAFWTNVPSRVWDYTIGGYQAVKKWLGYREASVLGRTLTVDEARHVTSTARRIAGLLLEP